MYKACIFDLDGTLANTLNSIAYFANNALKYYGYNEIEVEKYKMLVGNGAANLVHRMLEINGADNDEAFKKVSTMYNETYNGNYLYKTEAYEGVSELVKELKKMGFKLAVLSNKPHYPTSRIIESLFGDNFFDICYGQRENIPKKPDPTAAVLIAKELGVKTYECLYVGDTYVDMKTGNNANMFSIGVLWGFRDRLELEENNAKLIVSKPGEIIDYINKVQ